MPEWPIAVQWKLKSNDEGYHYKYCLGCHRQTEHDLLDCLRCSSLMIRKARHSADWYRDIKDAINKQD